jgi:hypothetical protein
MEYTDDETYWPLGNVCFIPFKRSHRGWLVAIPTNTQTNVIISSKYVRRFRLLNLNPMKNTISYFSKENRAL